MASDIPSLIALMLGRMRLSVQEAIDAYLRFAQQVFGNPRHLRWTKYSAQTFEKVLKGVLTDHCKCAEGNCYGENERMRQPDWGWSQQRRCMTTVVAQRAQPKRQVEETWLFRSYDHLPDDALEAGDRMNPGYADDEVRIWQVARATTAAPGFFPQMKIGNDPYMDGGVGANNPSDLAWHNARQASRAENPRIAILVSLGTGKLKKRSRFGVYRNIPALYRYGRHKITDTQTVHQHLVWLLWCKTKAIQKLTTSGSMFTRVSKICVWMNGRPENDDLSVRKIQTEKQLTQTETLKQIHSLIQPQTTTLCVF